MRVISKASSPQIKSDNINTNSLFVADITVVMAKVPSILRPVPGVEVGRTFDATERTRGSGDKTVDEQVDFSMLIVL